MIHHLNKILDGLAKTWKIPRRPVQTTQPQVAAVIRDLDNTQTCTHERRPGREESRETVHA
jgi:hypothetical protein